MYAPKDKPEPIVPVRLDLESSFSFDCDPEMACSSKCCRGVQIMLTPYDVIRMKQRIGISSDEFLSIYTTLGHIEQTDLPIPMLKMLDDDENPCPFLKENRCSIYEDRPVSCRYYPIGAGIFRNKDAASDEHFFALIKEGHCMGHELGTEKTVREWRAKEGIEPYDEGNDGWVELILKRKSLGPFVNIPEKTLQMFFAGCFNVDSFRRFVFDSKFLDVYEVNDDRKEAIAKDDVAMLDFAIDWLKTTLLGDPALKIREHVADDEE